MVYSVVRRFVKEEDGQGTVEYSLFLAFVGLAAVTALGIAKTSFSIIWGNLHSNRSSAGR